MHPWWGPLTHSVYFLAQPVYLATRYVLNPASFQTRSSLNLSLHVLGWLFIVTRITIPFFRSPLRHLPSPPGERFLLAHLNLNGGKPLTTLFENWLNATPNDGLMVIWGPLYLFCDVLVTLPEPLMEVLNRHNYDWEKPSMIKRVTSSILGQGLIIVEGATHKAMRRVVAPAFSGQQIRALASLFYSKGITLTDLMARKLGQTEDGVLEMLDLLSRATLDIIGLAGVGMDFNTLQDEDSPLAKLYHSVSQPPAFFLLVNAIFPSWLLRQLRGTGIARSLEAQSTLRNKISALMHEKKAVLNLDGSKQPNNDIIAHIMSSGDFSDDYLINQMLTFLFAGHDTTASGLIWAIYLLATHPDVQTRLRAECTEQLSNISPSTIDASIFDSSHTPFLNAVSNEALRLYPAVPTTPRVSVVPTTLNKIPIPPGTAATIPSWAVNRSPVLWGPDAALFKPDRWLTGPHAANGGAEHSFAFTTFLHGPRSCIGQAFARLQIRCVLAALVTRFEFEVADPHAEIIIGGFVIIKPEGGLRLKVRDLQADG